MIEAKKCNRPTWLSVVANANGANFPHVFIYWHERLHQFVSSPFPTLKTSKSPIVNNLQCQLHCALIVSVVFLNVILCKIKPDLYCAYWTSAWSRTTGWLNEEMYLSVANLRFYSVTIRLRTIVCLPCPWNYVLQPQDFLTIVIIRLLAPSPVLSICLFRTVAHVPISKTKSWFLNSQKWQKAYPKHMHIMPIVRVHG